MKEEAHKIRGLSRMMRSSADRLLASLPPEVLSVVSTVKVVTRVILIFGATATAAVMALLILGIVGPFDKSLARVWVERYVVGGWVEAVIGGPCFPCGNLFLRLSGELPRSDHAAAILLCNHQLDTDWLYLWEVLRVVQAQHLLKIVLLDEMRKVPVVGWAMEMAGFVFLGGKGGDADTIAKAAKALAPTPSMVLLFPEGTTVNVESQARSNEYAAKVGRPTQSLLLPPRCRGLSAAIEGFVQAGIPVEDVVVYDATMAYAGYSGEIPAWKLRFERERDKELPNVPRLLKGEPGRFVRVHADAFRASDIDEEWLDRRWTLKNSRLEKFAKNGDLGRDCGQVVDVAPRRRIGPLACITAVWTGIISSILVCFFLCAAIILPFLVVAAVVLVPCACCAAAFLSPFLAGIALLVYAINPALLPLLSSSGRADDELVVPVSSAIDVDSGDMADVDTDDEEINVDSFIEEEEEEGEDDRLSSSLSTDDLKQQREQQQDQSQGRRTVIITA